MSRQPEETHRRERVVTARLGPDDSTTFDRRRAERGNLSPSNYVRTLVREDGKKGKQAKPDA